MKILLILLLILSIGIVYAKDVDLEAGKSYEIDGKNVTLIRFDSRSNNAIFCVNGIKNIIEEDKTRTINEVFIEVKRIARDFVEIDASYKCKDCICDETCDNSICFDGEEIVEAPSEPPQELVDQQEPIEPTEQTQEPIEQGETVEPPEISILGIILAIVIFIVVILGLIVLWKKY